MWANNLQRLMGASLLVFKNKSDVPGCMSEDDIREVSENIHLRAVPNLDNARAPTYLSTQGLHLDSVRTHKWHILPCSAMTGLNLEEGLQWVVQDAKDRLFLY